MKHKAYTFTKAQSKRLPNILYLWIIGCNENNETTNLQKKRFKAEVSFAHVLPSLVPPYPAHPHVNSNFKEKLSVLLTSYFRTSEVTESMQCRQTSWY